MLLNMQKFIVYDNLRTLVPGAYELLKAPSVAHKFLLVPCVSVCLYGVCMCV